MAENCASRSSLQEIVLASIVNRLEKSLLTSKDDNHTDDKQTDEDAASNTNEKDRALNLFARFEITHCGLNDTSAV